MLTEERSRYLPRETGGFLIGLRRGPHIEVTGFTRQGPGDIATRDSFERACPSHRDHIHRVWKRSGQLESLVGDWHSHPSGTGDPSTIDVSAWRTLARTSGQAMIGLVDAGGTRPKIFLAAEQQRPFAVEMVLQEEDREMLAFEVPATAPPEALRRLVLPLLQPASGERPG